MNFIQKIAPETYAKIGSINKNKMRATISIGCFAGSLVVLPYVINNGSQSTESALIGIAYGVVFVFIIPTLMAVIAKLELAQSIMNDYSNLPAFVHWFIIIISLATSGVLLIVKEMNKPKTTSCTNG